MKNGFALEKTLLELRRRQNAAGAAAAIAGTCTFALFIAAVGFLEGSGWSVRTALSALGCIVCALFMICADADQRYYELKEKELREREGAE